MSGGGKKGSDQVVGYRYILGMMLGIGRGPINELVEIRVGDLLAWQGNVTASSNILINSPNLFGGDDKEGGIIGTATLMLGEEDQIPPDNVIQKIGGMVPGFRGVTTLFYYGQICANNPYPKVWKMRVRRADKGWENDDPWYTEKCTIQMADNEIKAMNPAHIIYECATNTAWGRGLPRSRIDDTAFRLAADTLYNEEFGMCLRWDRQDDIDKFVQTVINHIGGVIFIDRTTGLLRLNLIRNDYDPDDLPVFTYSTGLLEVQDDQSAANDTVYNEVIVKYHDPITDNDGQVRVQNLASFQALQAVISTSVDYPGIPTSDLAARVAQRDLEMQSNNVRRMTVKLDRRGRTIQPGDPFIISVPSRGIEQIIMRAGEVDESAITDGSVTVKAVEDVFNLPETSYVTPQPSTWVPPDRTAVPVDERRIEELTYYDYATSLTDADLSTVVVDTTALKALAKRPSGLSRNFVIASKAEGETDYAERFVGAFDTTAVLTSPAGLSYYTTDITFSTSDILTVAPGQWALIDDEYVRIDDIDYLAGTATIARGCIDTIPARHEAGVTLWFDTGLPPIDGREYSSGETAFVKLLTQTYTSKLSLAAAPEDEIDLGGRQGRPYPPGNLLINDTPFGDVVVIITSDIDFTWAHRNRLLEGDTLFEHQVSSIITEPGVTYTIRVYDGSDVLLRTASGITDDNWSYTSTMDDADGNANPVRFEVESVRGGLPSWQHYDIKIARTTITAIAVAEAAGTSATSMIGERTLLAAASGTSTAAAFSVASGLGVAAASGTSTAEAFSEEEGGGEEFDEGFDEDFDG